MSVLFSAVMRISFISYISFTVLFTKAIYTTLSSANFGEMAEVKINSLPIDW